MFIQEAGRIHGTSHSKSQGACADFEAAERRKKEASGETADETDAVEEEVAEVEVAPGDEAEAAPKKKRKAAVPKEPRPKRTCTPKVVRQRVIWAVFDNSNRRVRDFPYPQKQEAEEHAKKMMAEKGSTYFVQPVKEQIEEKKE